MNAELIDKVMKRLGEHSEPPPCDHEYVGDNCDVCTRIMGELLIRLVVTEAVDHLKQSGWFGLACNNVPGVEVRGASVGQKKDTVAVDQVALKCLLFDEPLPDWHPASEFYKQQKYAPL